MLELSRFRPNVVKLTSHDLCWPVDDRLFDKILSLVAENAWRKVKLDFRKVDFVSGAALGKIVALHTKLKARGVQLVIQNVGENVLDVFSVTGLVRILDIQPRKE